MQCCEPFGRCVRTAKLDGMARTVFELHDLSAGWSEDLLEAGLMVELESAAFLEDGDVRIAVPGQGAELSTSISGFSYA
jgi:hypothetical protein